MSPVVLELDLPEVTEWLPEHDSLPAEVNDAWIAREQELRWKTGDDRKTTSPVDRMFTMD
jgi:hypothetical protein